MQRDIDLSTPSQMILNVYEYESHLGQTNPIWQPVPQHYYPLSCKQVTLYIFYVLFIIFAVLAIFVGFIFWAVINTSTYVLIWTIVLLVVMVGSMILLYLGGKDRRAQQKFLIKETNRKQQQMANKER